MPLVISDTRLCVAPAGEPAVAFAPAAAVAVEPVADLAAPSALQPAAVDRIDHPDHLAVAFAAGLAESSVATAPFVGCHQTVAALAAVQAAAPFAAARTVAGLVVGLAVVQAPVTDHQTAVVIGSSQNHRYRRNLEVAVVAESVAVA